MRWWPHHESRERMDKLRTARGFFKGRIKIKNQNEEDAFNKEKEDRMGEIFDLIR